jgi:hypothetical protein
MAEIIRIPAGLNITCGIGDVLKLELNFKLNGVTFDLSGWTLEGENVAVQVLDAPNGLIELTFNEDVSKLGQWYLRRVTPTSKRLLAGFIQFVSTANVSTSLDPIQIDILDSPDLTVDIFSGEKGDKGDQGDQGIQGIQGPKGEDGDGTTTAETITATASANNHKTISSTVAVGSSTTMTASAYIKENTLNYASLVVTNQTANWAVITADLNTGTITKTGNSNYTILSSSIVDAGDGWYRLILTFVSTTAGSTINISLNDTDNPTYGAFGLQSWTSSGTESVFIWGAQLEIGDTATDYQAVASAFPSTTPLRANPTSNGILIEEARTNRLLWNRDATQTEWVKTNITAVKDQTGIDGVANSASSLTATDDNGTCIQTITLGAGNRTGSVYLKRLTGTGNIQVTLDGSTYSTVELSDTEWYRIVLSGSVTNPTVGIKIAVDGDAVAMDYGQVEDGLFVTTPILTTIATATRAQELVRIEEPYFGNFYNFNEGTFLVNTTVLSKFTSEQPIILIRSLFAFDRLQFTVGKNSNVDEIRLGGVLNNIGIFNAFALIGPSANVDYIYNNNLNYGFTIKGTDTTIVGSNKFRDGFSFGSTRIIDQQLNRLWIGQNVFGNTTTNLTVKRITYIPKSQNINQMQLNLNLTK